MSFSYEFLPISSNENSNLSRLQVLAVCLFVFRLDFTFLNNTLSLMGIDNTLQLKPLIW